MEPKERNTVDLYFMGAGKLIDIAAFMDRVERDGYEDFRYKALGRLGAGIGE